MACQIRHKTTSQRKYVLHAASNSKYNNLFYKMAQTHPEERIEAGLADLFPYHEDFHKLFPKNQKQLKTVLYYLGQHRKAR